MRSCDAVGVGTVHAVNPTGGIPTFSATSASADKWVEVKVHNNIEEAIIDLSAAKGHSQPIIVHSKNSTKNKSEKTSVA